MLKKIFIKYRFKIILIFICIFIFIFSNQYIFSQINNLNKGFDRRLINVLNFSVSAIDFNKVKQLSGTNDDLNTENYNFLKQTFLRIGEVAKAFGIKWIYIVRIEDNKVVFLIDSVNPDEKGYSVPGEIYQQVP